MPRPMNRVEKICEFCGKPFLIQKCKEGRPFCSRKCYEESIKSLHEIIKCKQCGKEFEARSIAHRQYCSMSCATTAKNLTSKNPAYHKPKGKDSPLYGRPTGRTGDKSPMYGKTREKNPNFKGGRYVSSYGYVVVLAPDDHPCRKDKKKPVMFEHRLIMEQHIGRYLEEDEIVHHIDGNPLNNAIENLCLYKTQSDHIHNGHPDFGKNRKKKTKK